MPRRAQRPANFEGLPRSRRKHFGAAIPTMCQSTTVMLLSRLESSGRIFDLRLTNAETGYAAFLDIWLQVYRIVEPAIDQADLSACPQKVRVFDRLLWYLG